MNTSPPEFDVPPYRSSGVVYGVALNDPAAIEALGDAVLAAPYRAAPVAPVLYLKPRNTLGRSGDAIGIPRDAEGLQIGATLGMVIGRTACRVAADAAMTVVAGYLLAVDLDLPHRSFHRPGVRLKALDGSCLLGSILLPLHPPADPSNLPITVSVDQQPVRRFDLQGMHRGPARLLADVTEFMTLRPGDVLLLGTRAEPALARPNQRFTVEAPGLGRLDGRVAVEAEMS